MILNFHFSFIIVKFGFVIPGSTNTWEAIYDIPPLPEGLIADMVGRPYATSSDSFYFVGDELVMHNKASYRYIATSLPKVVDCCYTSDSKEEVSDTTIGSSNSMTGLSHTISEAKSIDRDIDTEAGAKDSDYEKNTQFHAWSK